MNSRVKVLAFWKFLTFLMSSAQVLRLPMILGVLLITCNQPSSPNPANVIPVTLGVLISTMTLVVTKLALELMLDSSDRLSGLARGASPNQSSCIKSTLQAGLVVRFKLKLKLLVKGLWCTGTIEIWLLFTGESRLPSNVILALIGLNSLLLLYSLVRHRLLGCDLVE